MLRSMEQIRKRDLHVRWCRQEVLGSFFISFCHRRVFPSIRTGHGKSALSDLSRPGESLTRSCCFSDSRLPVRCQISNARDELYRTSW